MDLHTWLDAEVGRATALAEALDVSKTAVSLWRANGVPIEHMPRIVELCGGEVTIEAMVLHANECRAANAALRAKEAA